MPTRLFQSPVLTLAGENQFGLRTLQAAGLKIQALPGGTVYSISSGELLINQVLASPLSNGLQRCFLRVHGGDAISSMEVIGPDSASDFSWRDDRFLWTGVRDQLAYAVTLWLHPSGDGWFVDVRVTNRGAEPVRCDAILVQDLALATRGQARNNELYTSQYLDHLALTHASCGHVVMTRQNLPQPGQTNPWIVQGCLPATRGFTTDGFDFFGIDHRATQSPDALSREIIGETVRQYESAIIGLQSIDVELLPQETTTWTFFAHLREHHAEPSSKDDLACIEQVYQHARDLHDALESQHGSFVRDVMSGTLFRKSRPLVARDLDDGDLDRLFPGPRRHVETIDGKPHSFFTGSASDHVVLKRKELSVARPHGHILRTGQAMMPDDEILSVACYASGVFASQLALGNSSLAKLIPPVRDPLNLIRSSGLRILARHRHRKWEQLCTPSAFVMSASGCRWIYVVDGVDLIVSCAASTEDPALSYTLSSSSDEVEWLVCGEVAVGANEFEQTSQRTIDADRGRVGFKPSATTLLRRRLPRISFWLVTPDSDRLRWIGGDEVLSTTGEDADTSMSESWPCFAFRTRATRQYRFTILGTVDDLQRAAQLCGRYERGERSEIANDAPPTSSVRLRSTATLRGDDAATLSQLQDTLHWFARDATIHLSAPRGLEQANGAAWGVRDVCQGPVEFLLSYDDHATVATILRRLFSQQYARRHDWPQWFMFPPFQEIRSTHCHGDVVLWPLKALCDYLEHTDDSGFLRESLPYADDETSAPTSHRETVIEHVDRLISKIQLQFLPGTSLLKFGDGDWDDSLQPADPSLRERMSSSWTNALLYQTLVRWGDALERFEERNRAAVVRSLAASLRSDFHAHLMPDGVVAGFALFEPGSSRPAEYLLHPSDRRTGVKYRLIPMTRSIIAGLLTPEQAKTHLGLIREHLLYPDGARLMDRPMLYEGGRERVFKRAESASFFGREIGLQYVHAHLRYAEALAKLGEADALLEALQVVNPICVTDVVPNARPRQRNTYFTSSDAAFADRYQASRDYAKLKGGQIAVDGGWRLYSSGPGIYTNLVLRHWLGVRRYYDTIEFDPVIASRLGVVAGQISVDGQPIRVVIPPSSSARQARVNGSTLPSSAAPNPYRHGPLRVALSTLRTCGAKEIRLQKSFAPNSVRTDGPASNGLTGATDDFP